MLYTICLEVQDDKEQLTVAVHSHLCTDANMQWRVLYLPDTAWSTLVAW